MRRTINYTGRRSIPGKSVSITPQMEGVSISSFSAKIDLNDIELPPEARIYVDAHHMSERKRFDFGTVANIASPADTSLSDLAYEWKIRFRILAVDRLSSELPLICAEVNEIGFAAELEGRRESILSVEFRPLGQEVWQISYEDLDDGPILLINRDIPNIQNLARSDPGFVMQVYPAVIREILTHMFFIDGVDSIDDPQNGWHKKWLALCKSLLPAESLPENLLDVRNGDDNDQKAAREWIDRVVKEYCSSRNEWNIYVRRSRGDDIT